MAQPLNVSPLPDQVKLSVVYHRIDALRPDPANPRRHSQKHVRQLAASIRQFGFVVPVLVERDLKIIAGHGRVQAATSLGWSEVPTICLDHLTEPQARLLMIADNRLTEISEWDDQLLAVHLKELSKIELDCSLEITGFEPGEIEYRIESLEGDAEASIEEVPAVSAGPAVSKPGDLWILGSHRLVCGSALDEKVYRKLMGEDRAVLVITDPPYNVPINGHVSGLGKIRHREFAMASGEMTRVEFTAFLERSCELLARHSLHGSLQFLFIDWRHMAELLAAATRVYGDLVNLCVWVKTNAGMGSLYRSRHELVCLFKNGRGRHQNHIQLGKHGRNRTNVWEYPGATSFARSNGEEGNLLSLHPTVKPVAMIADALKDCSARGDRVLDAFLGSGTTLLAAERTGRRCYGIEIDPAYVDTAIRRWQHYTGEHARRADSGETFGQLAEALGGNHG